VPCVAFWGTLRMGAPATSSEVVLAGLQVTGVPPRPRTVGRARRRRHSRGSIPPTSVTTSTDVDAVLAGTDAVAYPARGDIRPEEAIAAVERCLQAVKHVATLPAEVEARRWASD
jgi:hypothetical protein